MFSNILLMFVHSFFYLEEARLQLKRIEPILLVWFLLIKNEKNVFNENSLLTHLFQSLVASFGNNLSVYDIIFH